MRKENILRTSIVFLALFILFMASYSGAWVNSEHFAVTDYPPNFHYNTSSNDSYQFLNYVNSSVMIPNYGNSVSLQTYININLLREISKNISVSFYIMIYKASFNGKYFLEENFTVLATGSIEHYDYNLGIGRFKVVSFFDVDSTFLNNSQINEIRDNASKVGILTVSASYPYALILPAIISLIACLGTFIVWILRWRRE